MCARQHTFGSLLLNREGADGARRPPVESEHPISVLELTKNEADKRSMSLVRLYVRVAGVAQHVPLLQREVGTSCKGVVVGF